MSIDAAELIQAEAAAILICVNILSIASGKVNLLELLTTVETALQEDPLEEGFNLDRSLEQAVMLLGISFESFAPAWRTIPFRQN